MAVLSECRRYRGILKDTNKAIEREAERWGFSIVRLQYKHGCCEVVRNLCTIGEQNQGALLDRENLGV